MKQDLGELIAPEKLAAATKAAINACGGAELGFLIDPLSCRYDPIQDAALLCEGSTGEPTGSAADKPRAFPIPTMDPMIPSAPGFLWRS